MGHQGKVLQLVKVTAAASGGGEYDGKLLPFHTGTLTATGTLADDDVGVEGGDILIFNLNESGQSTHDLTTGTPVSKVYPAAFIGMSDAGVMVFAINGSDFENCDDDEIESDEFGGF